MLAKIVCVGAALNPAASAQGFLTGGDATSILATIVAQCIGGVLALQIGCFLGLVTKSKKAVSKEDHVATGIMEFLGTLVLFLGFAAAEEQHNVILAGVSLFVAASMIFHGHFNPAFTVMSVLKGDTHIENAAVWAAAQIAGVYAAGKLGAFLKQG